MSQQPVTPIRPIQGMPHFEGQRVDYVTVKLTGMGGLDSAEDLVVSVDDRVRAVGEFVVVGVRHFVDKDGKLVREQIMRPIRVETCPWDPSQPDDDGVVRARPRPS